MLLFGVGFGACTAKDTEKTRKDRGTVLLSARRHGDETRGRFLCLLRKLVGSISGNRQKNSGCQIMKGDVHNDEF